MERMRVLSTTSEWRSATRKEHSHVYSTFSRQSGFPASVAVIRCRLPAKLIGIRALARSCNPAWRRRISSGLSGTVGVAWVWPGGTASNDLDDGAASLTRDGRVYTRVEATSKTMTSVGQVSFWRSRYRRAGEASVAPVDEKLGLAGLFHAAWGLPVSVPAERQHGAGLRCAAGNVRHRRGLGEQPAGGWAGQPEHWEEVAEEAGGDPVGRGGSGGGGERLRSLDGVMVPMRPGDRKTGTGKHLAAALPTTTRRASGCTACISPAHGGAGESDPRGGAGGQSPALSDAARICGFAMPRRTTGLPRHTGRGGLPTTGMPASTQCVADAALPEARPS